MITCKTANENHKNRHVFLIENIQRKKMHFLEPLHILHHVLNNLSLKGHPSTFLTFRLPHPGQPKFLIYKKVVVLPQSTKSLIKIFFPAKSHLVIWIIFWTSIRVSKKKNCISYPERKGIPKWFLSNLQKNEKKIDMYLKF